jgi:hypothetical protein
MVAMVAMVVVIVATVKLLAAVLRPRLAAVPLLPLATAQLPLPRPKLLPLPRPLRLPRLLLRPPVPDSVCYCGQALRLTVVPN